MKKLEVHERAVSLAKHYLETERELIAVLQEIDAGKIYLELNYTSLFQYCMQALGLSESQASNFIGVARKCVAVPELQQAIDTGALSVSKAKRIVSSIKPENSSLWIERAQTLPQREVERLVAAENGSVTVRPQIKPVGEDRSVLHCGISHALEKKLGRVRELLSQKLQRPASLEEALEALADRFLEKEDPVRKAERAAKRITVTRPEEGKRDPRAIPQSVRHAVFARDQGRCRHKTADGSRCTNRTFLHLHHLVPVSEGGQSTVDNLLLVCSAHHQRHHRMESRAS